MNILIGLLFIFLVCKLAYLYSKRDCYNVEVVSILLLIMLNMNVLLYVFFNNEYYHRQIQTVANIEAVLTPAYRVPIPSSRSRVRANPVTSSGARIRNIEDYDNSLNLVNLINSAQRNNSENRPDNDNQEDIGSFGSRRVKKNK